MSLQSRGVPSVEDRLQTLKYQHAVAFGGQKLLHLVMKTLIRGDINNIIGLVKDTLKTNTQFKNSFTKEEQEILATVHHEKWDISLLFKVIQKVCGLEKAGDSCWTQSMGGEECLEYYITTLKEERNKMVHDFLLLFNEAQLEDRLTNLTNVALNVTSALAVRAPLLGKQLSKDEPHKTIQLVLDIIEDAKGKINEGPPAAKPPPPPPVAVPESLVTKGDVEDAYESDSLQSDGVHFDGAFAAAGVGGQAFQGVGRQLSQKTALEVEIEKLTREIWMYAGPQDVDV